MWLDKVFSQWTFTLRAKLCQRLLRIGLIITTQLSLFDFPWACQTSQSISNRMSLHVNLASCFVEKGFTIHNTMISIAKYFLAGALFVIIKTLFTIQSCSCRWFSVAALCLLSQDCWDLVLDTLLSSFSWPVFKPLFLFLKKRKRKKKPDADTHKRRRPHSYELPLYNPSRVKPIVNQTATLKLKNK